MNLDRHRVTDFDYLGDAIDSSSGSLVGNFEWEEKETKITKGDYVKALLAVEDSLKTRREYHGHPRGYLDFLVDFIAQARP